MTFSADVDRWIESRLANAPGALLDVMRDPELDTGVEAEGAATIADRLAARAIRLYGEVLDRRGERDDALLLLAADALFTHAFQAQAESDPAALLQFAQRWGAKGELERLSTGREVSTDG